MKRNFLLTLLLTLLPFVGWAQQDPIVIVEPLDPVATTVAKIGEVEYESLQAAIDAAANGDVIVLQKNIQSEEVTSFALGGSATATVTTPRSYTIDMNGFNITAKFGWGGDWTTRCLFNLVASNTNVTITNKANPVTGGKITGTSDDSSDPYYWDISMMRVGVNRNVANGGIDVYNSSLTIDPNVEVVTTNTMCAIDVVTTKNIPEGGKKNSVNIYGKVTTLDNTHNSYTVGTHGIDQVQGGIINVYDGAVVTGGEAALYLPAGECNISGGILTGNKAGVVAKAGTLNITGGTITSTYVGEAIEYQSSDNGFKGAGNALQIENVGYPEGTPVVSVTGGKFVAGENQNAVGSYAATGYEKVTKFLKGGNYSSNPSTFSGDPSNFVALGFKVEETGLSSEPITYNVVPKAPGQVYNVTVSGINGQTKAYGEPLELSVSLITTDQNTINGNPEYMNQVKSLLELEDDLQFAKANTSPTYRFRLAKDVSPTTVVEEDGHYVYTFGTDYINVPTNETGDFDRYIVKPTGSGSITITKAESNTLGNTVLATDLTYNAEERNLVATAATAEFGTPKYWATTDKDVTAATIPASAEWVEAAALKEMNAGDYYVFVKVDGNDNYPGVDAQAAADPNKVTIAQNTPDYATNAEYQPTGNAFVFDNANHPLAVAPTAKAIGTYKYFASDKDKDHVELPDVETEAGAAQWSENIPQGKDDKTYVYWYVVGNNNVLGVAPAPSQVVTASIEAAPVTLDLAENTGDKIRGIEEEYLWKGEGVDITIPNGNNVVADPANLGGTIRYFIQKRADDTETFTGNEDKNYTMKVNKLGTYRVGADYKGIAGYVNDATLETTKYFEFEVVKPTLTIKINATPEVVGVGAVPTITWTPDWEEKGTDNVTAATDIHYSYYRVEGGNVSTIATPSNQLQVGNTYQVTTNKNNFTTTYHEVVIVPAQILVAPSEVQATIADNVTLVYGQRDLPLQLTYFSGFGEGDDAAKAKENFNKTSWTNGQFVATNNDTQEAYKLYYGKIVRINNNYWIEGSYAVKVGESVPNASSGNRKALPVGTYTVSANFESGNNAIIAKTGQWTVVAKSIANNNDVAGGDFTVNNIGDNFSLTKTYIGAQIVPTAADLLTIGDRYKGINYRYNAIVEGTDYEIVGPTDPTANINAGTGKFTVKGKGNFQGEKTLEFTIDRAEITVLPVKNPELTWAIGSNNTSYYTKIDYDDLERKLLGRDNKTVNKYSDFDVRTAQGFVDLRVRRLAPESVGRYVKGAEAYLPAGKEEAQNYKFKPGTAPLTVTKGKINLKVKPRVEAEYNGTSKPDFAFDFVVAEGSTLSEVLIDNDNWKTLIGTPGNPTWNAQTKQWNIVWDLEAIKEGDDRYVATKTYTVDYNPDKAPELGAKKNSEKMVANNYEVTVLPSATVAGKDICRGNAYVTEANIEFTVLDQNVPKAADVVQAVKFDGADATVRISAGGYKPGDNDFAYFVANIIVPTAAGKLTLAKVGENKVNKNYIVKVKDGTWGLAPTHEILELESKTTDLAKLETKRLVETVKLTLLQPEMKKNDGTIEKFQWLKNEWHALVLPFDAKVSEISAAFGYAIVNVVNPDGASEGDVVFKMPEITEIIPANNPFCIKVAKDIFATENANPYTATFNLDRDPEAGEVEGFLVVDPQGTHVSIAADNKDFGYTFDGTYVEKQIKKDEYYLRFLGKNSKWSKIGATSSAVFDMQPYTGYVNLGEGFTGTREVNFIFEEEDGSTTVIKDVDFMNGNKANAEGLYRVDGIKLQSAPTQKGVYIQDGKKFVK